MKEREGWIIFPAFRNTHDALYISLLTQPASLVDSAASHGTVFQSRRRILVRAIPSVDCKFMKRRRKRPHPTFMNTEETKSWGCLGLRCRVGAATAAAATCTSSPRMLMLPSSLPSSLPRKGLPLCLRTRASAPTRDSWDPRLYRGTYPPTLW